MLSNIKELTFVGNSVYEWISLLYMSCCHLACQLLYASHFCTAIVTVVTVDTQLPVH